MQSSIELLKTKECLRTLALLSPDAHFDPLKLSLYERFAFLCDMLSALTKNRVGRAFLECVGRDVGFDVDASLLQSGDAQKALWRALVCAQPFVLCDGTRASELSVNELSAADKRELDIRKYILCSDAEDLNALIDSIFDVECDSLLVDLADFVYSRPDEYHCAMSYKKIRDGEKCTKEELSALVCWCLCRVLMREERQVSLLFADDTLGGERVIELLGQRKLSPVIDLCVGADKSELVEKIAEICFFSEGISSFLEICASENDNFGECIERALNILPINRVRLKFN